MSLEVRGLTVHFGSRPVVRGVDLQVGDGERVALVGASGSGKTVTALSLLRLLDGAQVQGQVKWAPVGPAAGGDDLLALDAASLRKRRGAQIAVIFQEPMSAFNPLFSVGEQIAEGMLLHQKLSREEADRRVEALLARTGLEDPADKARRYPHQLSGGQRQRAMIAMALACDPQLLIADEPTTALDAGLRLQILDLLADIQRERGLSVLMITHDLHMVRRYAQRVVVMHEGEVVESGPVGEVLVRPRHPRTQALLDSRPARVSAPVDPLAQARVQARGLRVHYPVPRPGWRGWFGRDRFEAVRGVDLRLRAGQTVAVVGGSGSGKTTLALAVLGLLPSEGGLEIAGRTWQGRVGPDRALRRIVQVVFQDPFGSLSPRMNIETLVGEGLGIHAPGLDAAGRRARVVQALVDVGLDALADPGLLARYPHQFSGGQRQRLALARALVVEPEVLVLDEPTSALDVAVQRQVLGLLQELQLRRGLAYLLITHDIEVVRALAHEVCVMQAGEIVEQGALDTVLGTPRHPATQALVAASA